jgi:hypothetical protein
MKSSAEIGEREIRMGVYHVTEFSNAFCLDPKPLPNDRYTIVFHNHVDSMLESPDEFLETVEGEITFFRSVMKARPVGLHKHFHVLAIRNAIHNDTGRVIPVDSIWEKLRTCYDLDALETVVSCTSNFIFCLSQYPPGN